MTVDAVSANSSARTTVSSARSLGRYDLLLCSLLAFIAAARLWNVSAYLRADTWLALTTGRLVWHEGIPHHETLTALAAGHAWIDQQWLSQLLSYGSYRLGGFGFLSALSVLFAAGAFASMVAVARRQGARARTVLLVMPVTAFPFFAQAWQPRTQMFAYPMFAAVFVLLMRDARRHAPRVLLVLPLLIIWANLHGSAVLGAALIALRGLTLIGRRRALGAVLLTLPWPALLVTPYGIHTASYYSQTLFDPAFKQLATEWQPITADPILFAPFVLLLPMAAWALTRARARTTLFERLALVVLIVGAATALRNMVWLSLGAVPILAVAFDSLVPREVATRTTALNRGLAIAGACAAAVAFAVAVGRPAHAFERQQSTGYLEAVRAAAEADPSARIVADIADADRLLWQYPQLSGRIAFDARFELLPATGIHDVASMLSGSEGSSLLHGSYRIFALDRHAAGNTIRSLEAVPGHHTVYRDSRRAVVRVPA